MNRKPKNKFSKDRQPENKKPRGKSAVTKLKEAIGIDKMMATIEQIEENIDCFIRHKDEKIRFEATKAFVDYYKPKKKDVHLEGNVGVSLNVNLTGIDEDKLKKMFNDKQH